MSQKEKKSFLISDTVSLYMCTPFLALWPASLQAVEQKCIVGSNLFLITSPLEWGTPKDT